MWMQWAAIVLGTQYLLLIQPFDDPNSVLL